MNNITKGKQGEEIACNYLIKQGYKILERNKRFSKLCEIDIIALDKRTVVFCEVKTRSTDICGAPQEAVTKAKYQNIKKGIFFYLQENPKIENYRIDVVSVLLKPSIKITHLKNI